jgi:hypothetical protein
VSLFLSFQMTLIPEVPVFAGSHKIHASVTGTVFSAITIPMPDMLRWYMEINWLPNLPGFTDDDGLPIDETGSPVANNHIPINARSDLSGNTKPDTDIIPGEDRANTQ